jgi:HEAT repeat protein
MARLNHAAVFASNDAAGAIRPGLESRHAVVVARGAVLARELDLRELDTSLVAAYETIAQDPESFDPVCAAMKEIVATLFEFGTEAPGVFLHAVKHVQQAGWDNQDVAAPLRGLAIQALVKIEHPAALTVATDILVDGLPASSERDDGMAARVGAAKALRTLGSEASAHVLRLKVTTPDPSAEVYGECFAAMLEYSPAWLDAVGAFLVSQNDVLASMAALVIGETRPAGALEFLAGAWEAQSNPDVREALLSAIASLRSDEAVEFLVQLVGGESISALQAMSCLTLFAANQTVVSRVRTVAKSNKRREVAAMFERLFN